MAGKRRRFRPKPLTTRRKLVLSAIVALPVLTIFMFGNRGLVKRITLENRYDNAMEELYEERNAGDSLRSEIRRLQTDSIAVEKLARERFGMARPGERVYKVVEGE